MMQIDSIIIYGKNGKKRILKFNLGRENIITGSTKTGKSAIGQIIEYCLGSKTCDISAGIVRQYTDWFGLVLILDNEECFVARKNPEVYKNYCNAMYYEISKKISIPEMVNWESNIDNMNFVKLITSRIGIEENIHFTPINNTRDDLTANIRHALFYCFQFQYEIANPIKLFHKEQEDFIQQAIKDTMPYFFGVIDKRQIDLKQELQDLKRELTILERKEKNHISVQGGKNKVLQLLDEAAEVGLINSGDYNEDDDIDVLVSLIKQIENSKINSVDSLYENGESLTQYQIELENIQNQQSDLNLKIDDVKYALKISEEYNSEKAEQKKRLESLELFNKLNFDDDTCPFCSQKIENLYPSFKSLENSLRKLEGNLIDLNSNELPLRSYLKKLNDEKQDLTEKIKNLKSKIIAIQKNRDDIEKYKDLGVRQGKVIGRISFWLESYKEEPVDNKRKDELQRLIEESERILSEENIFEQMDSILNIISADMTKWAKEIDLEYPDSQYRFSYYNATVFVDTLKEGAIPLRKLGSGSNWVGIHLLAYFALQKYFIEKKRPVPSFLLLDQPSQIYFPNDNNKTDWEAVKKIYEFINNRVKELNGKLQVIVLDHADFPNDFNFNDATIERWDKDTNALIPYDWIN